MKTDCLFTLIGATGDLSKRKLIPAIYNLFINKRIDNFAIVGVAKDKSSPDKILAGAKKYIKRFNKKAWDEMKKRTHYFQTDFYDKKKFCGLGNFVRSVEIQHKLTGNRLFYLATLPQHFGAIADTLKTCNLDKKEGGWVRVAFEKPFGEDLQSAKKINSRIRKLFKEDQIFRMDHYLGKELVQNISILRFTNTILEPLWNKKYIDHIQIILSENIGVEDRGNFYDKYGALKDVVQNHMLQLLSLTAMESPKVLNSTEVRGKKSKVLKSIKINPKDVVLGQYVGYKKEKGVKTNSSTETFAALKVKVDSTRWSGVPFYLITGKNMKDKITSIYVEFKNAPCDIFKGVCNFSPNHLLIQIQPDEGFHIHLNVKVPGKNQIAPVKMDFCHKCAFGLDTPEAYENLFVDIVKGDQSVFIRSDEIELSWRIVDKIIRNKPKLVPYKKGSHPKEADDLIKKDKRSWYLQVK